MDITYRRKRATGDGSNHSELKQIEIFIDASWCLDGHARGQSGMVLKIHGNTIFFRTSRHVKVLLQKFNGIRNSSS